MRRRLLKPAVFLALGAIVNVAVAWGCALWIELRWEDRANVNLKSLSQSQLGFPEGIFGGGYFRAGAARMISWWPPPLAANASREEIAQWIREYHIGTSGDSRDAVKTRLIAPPRWCRLSQPRGPDGPLELCEDARGWPCLAMHCDLTVTSDSNDTYVTAVQNGIPLRGVHVNGLPALGANPVITLPSAYTRAIVLPLRPIWLGFLANTVFYAVALRVLLAGPFALRRWRRRRGLCLKCAYSLRGIESPQCPECGALCAARSKLRR